MSLSYNFSKTNKKSIINKTGKKKLKISRINNKKISNSI